MMLVCSNELDVNLLTPEKEAELLQTSIGAALHDVFVNRKLNSVFQPIIGLKTKRIFAFEALTRGPVSGALFSPVNLFRTAQDHGCLLELDRLARQIAIERFSRFNQDELDKALLFLNVSVQTFMEDAEPISGMTLDCLKKWGLSPDKVVIEVTELEPIDDYDTFIQSVQHYRNIGFQVAIDDLGGGYNGLRLWSKVQPDFVKIDRHFISGLNQDEDKRRFIETIITLAKSLGTKVIAEGVAEESELKFLIHAGVDYVQGYLFKRPCATPQLELDYQWAHSNLVPPMNGLAEETALLLSRPTISIEPDMLVADCSRMMLDDSNIEFLPVVTSHSQVVGVVWRRNLMDRLARPYGQSLHFRKRVDQVMDPNPICIDKQMPVVELSRLVTNEQNRNLEQSAFIVMDQGRYLGTGTFYELLKLMTDLRVKSAQHANPLSGLPGNLVIQQQLSNLLHKAESFVVMYIDIDNFKPYNDYYSFEQGDDVIRTLADLLQRLVGPEDFVGHVGGDDFMIFSSRLDHHQELSDAILCRFQDAILDFYREEDRIRGGIEAINRYGQSCFFNLMSLSIGVLVVQPHTIHHTQHLASIATKAKKGAKGLGGNCAFVLDTANL